MPRGANAAVNSLDTELFVFRAVGIGGGTLTLRVAAVAGLLALRLGVRSDRQSQHGRVRGGVAEFWSPSFWFYAFMKFSSYPGHEVAKYNEINKDDKGINLSSLLKSPP